MSDPTECAHGGGLKLVLDVPGVPEDGALNATLFNAMGVRGQIQILFDDVKSIAGDVAELGAESDPLGSSYSRLADAEVDERIDQLTALSTAIGQAKRKPWPECAPPLPSIYVYFGQFLAHEVSRLHTLKTGKVANLNSAALDLDTIFWSFKTPPGVYRSTLQQVGALQVGNVAIGLTSETGIQNYHDLPRYKTGFPLTPDCRSDANVFVAQLQVAITRYYVKLVRSGVPNPEGKLRDAIHRITLHDFLPKIIDPDTWSDVMTNERRIVNPGNGPPQNFRVPIEFSAATYRFGHVMARDLYQWSGASSSPVQLNQLLGNTFNGGSLQSRGGSGNHKVLEWDWPAVWRDSNKPSAMNVAEPIVPAISASLRKLGPEHVPEQTDPVSLARLTLLRGSVVMLPSAQSLWLRYQSAMQGAAMTCCEIVADQPPAIREALTAGPPGDRLCCRTPLWFYTLREAEKEHGGARLGPLAGRIVMETLHAAICSARNGQAPGPGGPTLPELLCESIDI